MAANSNDELEMIFVIDGDRAPRSRWVSAEAVVEDTIAALARELERENLEAIYREDEELALAANALMRDLLAGEFQVLHLGRHAKVQVEVGYNGRTVHETFSPSATIRSVIVWAISPKGLNLQGDVCDFQIKLNGELLPPELHVGQLSHHHHEAVRLALVFKVKPQG